MKTNTSENKKTLAAYESLKENTDIEKERLKPCHTEL